MSDLRKSPGYVDEDLLRTIARKLEPIKVRSHELLTFWRTTNSAADRKGTFFSTVTGTLVWGTKQTPQPGEGSRGKNPGSIA